MIFSLPLLFSNATPPPPPPMKYVIACDNNIIITSQDGVTWTQRSIPAEYGQTIPGAIRSIRYVNGYYFAVGYARINSIASNGRQILVSSDAINWRVITFFPFQYPTVELPNAFNDVYYVNGFYGLTGDRNGPGFYMVPFRSYDTYKFAAISIPTPPPLTNTYRGVVHNNVAYFGSSDTGRGYVTKTTDAKIFQNTAVSYMGSGGITYDIVYHTGINPGLYAIEYNTTDGTSFLRSTNDGSTWTRRAIKPGLTKYMANSSTVMVAAGNTVYRSADGNNWSNITGLPVATGLAYDGSKFCMTTTDANKLYTSVDGITWNNIILGNPTWNPLAIFAA